MGVTYLSFCGEKHVLRNPDESWLGINESKQGEEEKAENSLHERAERLSGEVCWPCSFTF